ncbi:MAG: TlpA disulfide reductase family protein [Planctomycetia bacterium]|nr:TlpA disulfide reductase family protein [Planctomycetia bacterium]
MKSLLFSTIGFVLLAFLTGLSSDANFAQEVAATSGSGAEFQLAADASNADRLDLAKKLLTTDREFDTEEEYKAWLDKMFTTVLTLTDQVMQTEQDDELYRTACGMRGQVLAYRAMTKKETRDSFEDFVTALENSERVCGNPEGKKMATAFRAIAWQDEVAGLVESEASLETLGTTLDQICQFVKANPDQASLVFDLIYPVSLIADERGKPELAGELLSKFSTGLKDSTRPEHKQVVAGLEGTLRFHRLAGQEFPIQGVSIEGEPFDQATLKNKVVLVHFWATWCVPYLTVYPELLTVYNQYKDDGLEFVGYSIDMELAPLRQFLKDKELPWPVLSEGLGTQNKIPSMREYYGITGIPTFVLIGRDGKVISQYVTVETLSDELTKAFAK